MTSAADAIQEIIDRYSTAGANLLDWITPEDEKTAPTSKSRMFPVSETDWRDWASDVACRAAFRALREAKEAATQPHDVRELLDVAREDMAMCVAEMSKARGRIEALSGCNEDRRIAAALGSTCDHLRRRWFDLGTRIDTALAAPTTQQGTDSGLADEVTQADREAAARLLLTISTSDIGLLAERIRRGIVDDHPFLTALRTDRKAVLEEAAKVADQIEVRSVRVGLIEKASGASKVASAIRALADRN